MREKEKIVILLFISISLLSAAASIYGKRYRKARPLPPEYLAETIYAQQTIEGNKLIYINSADRYSLAKLPGIGPGIAESIVDYRCRNNGFSSKEELLCVKGIGLKRYNAIKERVVVGVSK